MAGTLVLFEALEGRRLLSGFMPAQIVTAYGFNQITFDGGAVAGNGAGQTIALIEVDNDLTLNTDLGNFDAAYGLSNPGSGWSLSVVGENGGGPPATATTSSETIETDLDVEWAHAIAPAANILVVEANSPTDGDLYSAVGQAANTSGVSVVSMSYTRFETSLDPSQEGYYTTPEGHTGITFVAAAGDSAGPSHPANSVNVVGVGGTKLTLGANNAYQSETVWNDQYGTTGGGTSQYEPEPAYQSAVQNTGFRTTPDVAYDADPNTGFDIYVTLNGILEEGPIGGTSAGTPQWAALFAIADQGRELNGLGTLDGPSQTLPMLYALVGTPLYNQAFHDITSGTNGLYSAGPGYDETTGLGSPQANVLVQYLAGNIALPEPASFAVALAALPILMKRPKRNT
ncbi:MAG: S53 family peptidase [Tepidisphaeraceae bacterium]|jgi:subtilase family serine protease